jgi:hypothetical protein
MQNSQKYRSHSDLSEGLSVPDRSPMQRVRFGGCPRVVHGLRAAQPAPGDACIDPREWGSGGQRVGSHAAAVIEARSCSCVAPLNACGVEADAGKSAATGRRTLRAAELRCSGRVDSLSQTAGKARSGRGMTARPRRHRRAPTAVTPRAGPTPRSDEAATPRGPARSAPAASGHPWPSPLNSALRPGTLGVLPRECVRPLRARTKPDPAGAPRVRWSRTPGTPAASLIACRPHPRIARIVCAPNHRRRARSRGYRRPCDITRNYAAAVLPVRRGMRHPWRMKSRARVIRRYVTWPPARPCAQQGVSASMRCIASSCTRCARLRAILGLPPRSARGSCARVQCAAPARPRPRARRTPQRIACGRLTARSSSGPRTCIVFVRRLEAKAKSGRQENARSEATARAKPAA